MDTRWDKDATEELATLWDTDLSARQIAAEMGGGITKNAVISKAIRMGLTSRGRRCEDPSILDARKKRKTETSVRARRIRQGRPEEPPVEIKVVAPVNPCAPLNLTFEQIGRFQCRWIENEDMSAPLFCGHEVADGTSWCAFHKSVIMPPRREVSEQEAKRRQEWGKSLGLSRIAARRSGIDLRARSAAMPVE